LEIKRNKIIAISNHLLDKGVYRVSVEFSGSGDDGDIDEIIYYDVDDWEVSIDADIDKTLEDFFYSEINKRVHRVGDWVNNDGGYGRLEYHTESREARVEYYQRTTEEYGFPEEPLFV